MSDNWEDVSRKPQKKKNDGWEEVKPKKKPDGKAKKKAQPTHIDGIDARLVNIYGTGAFAGLKSNGQPQPQPVQQAPAKPESDSDDDLFMRPQAVPKTGKQKKQRKPSDLAPKPKENETWTTVAEMAKKMDASDFDSFLKAGQEQYGSEEGVQLRRVAEYFRAALKGADARDMVNVSAGRMSEALDYPICHIKPQLIKMTQRCFQRCSKALPPFFHFLCETVAKVDVGEKHAGIGYPAFGVRVMLQILLKMKPALLIKKFDSVKIAFFRNDKLPANLVPTFAWMIGQVLEQSADVTVHLWGQYLLPYCDANELKVRDTCVALMEVTAAKGKVHTALLTGRDTLSAEEYHRVLQLAFPFNGAKPSKTVGQTSPYYVAAKLQAILPRIRDLSVTLTNAACKRYFTPLLDLLSQNITTNTPLSDEVMTSLFFVLAADPHIANVWKECYPRRCYVSAYLSQFIDKRWELLVEMDGVELTGNVKKSLADCMNVLIAVHEDIVSQGVPQSAKKEMKQLDVTDEECMMMVKSSLKHCINIRSRVSSSNWAFWLVLLVIVGAVIAFVGCQNKQYMGTPVCKATTEGVAVAQVQVQKLIAEVQARLK
eukprot:GFYU01005675.1.p1 GENE.GFYU01005675.1~~GFYU01005675.1.p1  ORF type:complete len:610 (+),score=183.18 GFYU01005675.1:37-1830(+)